MVNLFNPGAPCRGGYAFSPGLDPENSRYRIATTPYPLEDQSNPLCFHLFSGEYEFDWVITTTGLSSCGSNLDRHIYRARPIHPYFNRQFSIDLLIQSTPCFPRYEQPPVDQTGALHSGFGQQCATTVTFFFGGIYTGYNQGFWYDTRDNQFKTYATNQSFCGVTGTSLYAFTIVRINPDLTETLCLETILPELDP